MKTYPRQTHGSACDSACAHCASSYECGILSSALCILEAIPPAAAETVITPRLDRLLAQLAAARFGYPDAAVPCTLVEYRQVIVGLTAEAIEVLDGGRQALKRAG